MCTLERDTANVFVITDFGKFCSKIETFLGFHQFNLVSVCIKNIKWCRHLITQTYFGQKYDAMSGA